MANNDEEAPFSENLCVPLWHVVPTGRAGPVSGLSLTERAAGIRASNDLEVAQPLLAFRREAVAGSASFEQSLASKAR
jgi:hypothetical protein